MTADLLFGIAVCLLPLAAWSGWYFGRRESGGTSVPRRVVGMSPDYFRGLDHLLNDRPDKAIEVFIKVLEVETETVETHLALGNLFRRRGEVDRAIRIHQNLVARPSLEFDQRALALLELALDYMRSGLFDRAESLFKELLEIGAHQYRAIEHLVDIYQQERDWEKALEYIIRLEKLGSRDSNQRRAHFLCEQAEALLSDGALDEASERLREAVRVHPQCVRANLVNARLAMASGAHESAIRYLQRIETQDLAFLPEAIPRLAQSYRALNRLPELMAYLRHLGEMHVGITPVLYLVDLMSECGDFAAAKQRLMDELKSRPTVRGIDRLIDYSLINADRETRENLLLLKEVTARLIEQKLTYGCGNCGFKGRALHWQCPSCKTWNSVKPIHGIEGE